VESPVSDKRLLPVVAAEEVEAFARRLPFAVDRAAFLRFALGFPRGYLAATAPVEVVRHFALMESLGARPVISSLSQEGDLWRLSIMARDRQALFARIAGALSCFEMNIVSAEAFANANSLILDTFRFSDGEGHFAEGGERRHFQVFLEEVVEGKLDVEVELRKHPEAWAPQGEPLVLEWDDVTHPSFTRLSVAGRDHFGLLYRIARSISEQGVDIQMAYIETPGEQVRDEFYLTRAGGRLAEADRAGLAEALSKMVERA
jgi:[protein-PII] uridylyltransferase